MLKMIIAVATMMVSVVLLSQCFPTEANAAECSEGKRNGKCINAKLAGAMRLEGRALAQRKLSQTAAPVPVALGGSGGASPAFQSTSTMFRSAPCRQSAQGVQC